MVFLKIQNLYKTFNRIVAVNRLNLEIQEREFFTLLGSSGCGKTTTLRLVGGSERPDGGEIYLGDRCFASDSKGLFVKPDKREMGMVFQSYALWPHTAVLLAIFIALTVFYDDGACAEPKAGWQVEWERTVEAAKKEGAVVLYASDDYERLFAEFHKKYPEIAVKGNYGRGQDVVQRMMSERRAGKYIEIGRAH